MSRNLITTFLALLILFAAAASSTRGWTASQEHHRAHVMVHEGGDHDTLGSLDSGDSALCGGATADDGCSRAVHDCCPGFTGALPEPADMLAFSDDSTPIAFVPTLRLTARVDGIFKPPWLNS